MCLYELYSLYSKLKKEEPINIGDYDLNFGETVKNKVLELMRYRLNMCTSEKFFLPQYKDGTYKDGTSLGGITKLCESLYDYYIRSYCSDFTGDLMLGFSGNCFTVHYWHNLLEGEEARWAEEHCTDNVALSDRYLSEVPDKYRCQAFTTLIEQCGLYDIDEGAEMEAFGMIITCPWKEKLNSFISSGHREVLKEDAYKKMEEAFITLKSDTDTDSLWSDECLVFTDTYTSLLNQGYGGYGELTLPVSIIVIPKLIEKCILSLNEKYHFLGEV